MMRRRRMSVEECMKRAEKTYNRDTTKCGTRLKCHVKVLKRLEKAENKCQGYE